jgi:hypothetical protein
MSSKSDTHPLIKVVMLLVGIVTVMGTVLVIGIALVAWCFVTAYAIDYNMAAEAMNVYPGAELVYETDHREDGNHAVQSYYYVTDDPLGDVYAYYVHIGRGNVFVDGWDGEWFQDFDDFDQIKRYGGGRIIAVHEDACAILETYADCTTTILISLDEDDIGTTLIDHQLLDHILVSSASPQPGGRFRV